MPPLPIEVANHVNSDGQVIRSHGSMIDYVLMLGLAALVFTDWCRRLRSGRLPLIVV